MEGTLSLMGCPHLGTFRGGTQHLIIAIHSKSPIKFGPLNGGHPLPLDVNDHFCLFDFLFWHSLGIRILKGKIRGSCPKIALFGVEASCENKIKQRV